MTAISDFVEDAMLDHYLRNVAAASPTSVYLALYVSATGDDNSGTEATGTSYAREVATFDPSAAGATQNAAQVAFGPAGSGGWGTGSHVGILDSLTGGNLLFWGALQQSKLISAGDTPNFNAGDLTVSLD